MSTRSFAPLRGANALLIILITKLQRIGYLSRVDTKPGNCHKIPAHWVGRPEGKREGKKTEGSWGLQLSDCETYPSMIIIIKLEDEAVILSLIALEGVESASKRVLALKIWKDPNRNATYLR